MGDAAPAAQSQADADGLALAVSFLETAQGQVATQHVAAGGQLPYQPKQPSEVLSVAAVRDAVARSVGAFEAQLAALLAARPEGELPRVDATGLRLPTLPEEVDAEDNRREVAYDAKCEALLAARAAREAEALPCPGDGDEAVGARDGACGAAGSSSCERSPDWPTEPALQVVKRRRLERMAQAAQRLASVASAVSAGQHVQRRNKRFLPEGPAIAAGAADSPADGAARDGGTDTADAAGSSGGAAELLCEDELLLHVQVHHPELPARAPAEYLVPASLPLSGLRDAVYCVTDVNITAAAPGMSAPSAYMYFEGVFYLDTRSAAAVDYSAPLRAFCAKHGITPPGGARYGSDQVALDAASGFGTAAMQGTTFAQLHLQANGGRHKYIYCHQGGCEHALTFVGARRRHADDPPALSSYPLLLRQGYRRSRLCGVCELRKAAWVTRADPLAPECPAFWCERCFEAMHLDASGLRLAPEAAVLKYTHE